MLKNDLVTYTPGSYDLSVITGPGPFLAVVTRVRENGLVDIVFGDHAGMGVVRTSVGVNSPSVAAEGYVTAGSPASPMGGGGPGEERLQ